MYESFTCAASMVLNQGAADEAGDVIRILASMQLPLMVGPPEWLITMKQLHVSSQKNMKLLCSHTNHGGNIGYGLTKPWLNSLGCPAQSC